MSPLEFHDERPPTRAGLSRQVLTPELIEEMREHPNQWAIIHRGANPSVASLWAKRYPYMSFTSRMTGGGKADIWASYTGETS